jgi:hypothetical protein
LRSQVKEFLSGAIDLDSFEDWFLSHNWNAHFDSAPEVVHAIHRIEGALLDFSSEMTSENALRLEMANAIRPFEQNLPVERAEIRRIPPGSVASQWVAGNTQYAAFAFSGDRQTSVWSTAGVATRS